MLSGRTNEQVKADPDRMWRADLPAAQASVVLRRRPGARAPPAALPPSPPPDELAALGGLGASGTWEIFGRQLRLTNLDKELFPGRAGGPR